MIEAVIVAAPADRVHAHLVTSRPGWRLRKGELRFAFDVVGDHVEATFHVDLATPALLALTCTATTIDLGWTTTRVHLAIASTAQGCRIALLHAGVPAGATRDVWRQFLDELAASVTAAAA
ncbi:MAG TPA: hypothetical protein VFQ53_07275 [Kofleriaceae bacterium]|nr:hypothetical protein [Kofleriaceae bacterium]